MLELLQRVQSSNPQLSGTKLYEKVVADRLCCDEMNARNIVRDAEQSFARWPVHRNLTFRDVVNHLIGTQLTAANGGVVDTRFIVERVIPINL